MDRFEVELRTTTTGNKIVGHASVFDQIATVPGGYETITRTAFDEVLKDPDTDVRALINHDPNQLLGRQSAGTLKLGVDDEGLAFEVELPDTSYARDLRALAERGDINGASFGFIPGDDKWTRAPDGRQLRSHTSVRSLVDVSVVTFPAYAGAGVALRSIQIERRLNPRAAAIRSRAIARGLHPSK